MMNLKLSLLRYYSQSAGAPEEINDYYDMFLDSWIEEVPAEVRAYFQILLDIVE